MSTVEIGNTVIIHYTGTLNNGTEFDSSRNRDALRFEVGAGQELLEKQLPVRMLPVEILQQRLYPSKKKR